MNTNETDNRNIRQEFIDLQNFEREVETRRGRGPKKGRYLFVGSVKQFKNILGL